MILHDQIEITRERAERYGNRFGDLVLLKYLEELRDKRREVKLLKERLKEVMAIVEESN